MGQLDSESLAGRLALAELGPLRTAEILPGGAKPSFDELVFRGEYPELWAGTPDPQEWSPAYVSTYLQRDLRALALRSGSLLNYADLARDVGTT